MLGTSVDIYNPNSTHSLELSDFRLLQLSRPTHKTRFVRNGEDIHLLVYLSAHHQIPFVRVPIESLVRAIKKYECK